MSLNITLVSALLVSAVSAGAVADDKAITANYEFDCGLVLGISAAAAVLETDNDNVRAQLDSVGWVEKVLSNEARAGQLVSWLDWAALKAARTHGAKIGFELSSLALKQISDAGTSGDKNYWQEIAKIQHGTYKATRKQLEKLRREVCSAASIAWH